MQTPKFLQSIKSRFLTTGLTTVGTVGLSGYLATLAQQQGTQSAEATVITLLAGVFMASAPKLLDVILGVTSNIISSDLYDKFTKQEIYKQIPAEANLYLATYTTFQSILNEVIQAEEKRADKKQIKKLRDITYQSWLELVSLDEQKDDVREVAQEVLGKFKDENLIENQFLQAKSKPQKDLLSRQDWLILLLRLQDKEETSLPADLEEKILDVLEKNYTERLRSVFSAHQEIFQEVTLQLWETLFGKLDKIEGKIDQLLENQVSQQISSDSFIQVIDQAFLDLQKTSDQFSAESFYLANYPAQWWGILNDFDEKTKIFHDVKKQIDENFYYDAPIVAYLRGSGGTGKTTLARQLVIDFVSNETDYDCWWIECREFEKEELVYIEKHLKEISESRKPTLFVLDDWSKFDDRTKSTFRKLFDKLNKIGGNLKFVITDRKLNNSQLPTNLLSRESYFFDKRRELDFDNNAILQKVFDVLGENYKTLSERLFSADEVATAKPFFLLYVLIRIAKDRDLLNYLSKEAKSAERYFKEIVEFDLGQLSQDQERKGLVSAIGFISYLKKKHNQTITKDAFLLIARRYSKQDSAFNLIKDYQNKPIKQWRIVGQYLYSEKSIRNKREDAPYFISFNKDDFIDAILEANIFEEFNSISEYIDEQKAEMSSFLIENGDNTSASYLAYAFCYKEETLKYKSQKIIQRLLDNKNEHHAYAKIFFRLDNNFADNEQKWKWIEHYLGFTKDNHFFQSYCVAWLKKVFENDKYKLLLRLNELNKLGAKSHEVINAILKTTEGKQKINKAKDLLRNNNDKEVICNCLEVLKNEPDAQNIARELLENNKDHEVICKCLEILKNESDAQVIARNLLEANKSIDIICVCLEILKNEPDAKHLAKDLLKNNKDHQVICKCLEILKNEPDAQAIATDLLENNKDHQIICTCLEILKNEPNVQDIARELLENNKDHQVICVCLEITQDITAAKELLAKENQNTDIICRCLPILKETSQGRKYALNILTEWENKNANVVIRSLEVLAGTNEAEAVTQEIINDHKGKQFYLYQRIMKFGNGNYDCWQKEVKRVIKNWWKNSELVVGHCLRHSEDNYFDTQNVCLGYLEEWETRIRRIKRKEKPVFYFMTKSLAHPYLRKEAKETAREMLEYEKNNKGFLPDDVMQVAEDIIETNIFPEWHTTDENN